MNVTVSPYETDMRDELQRSTVNHKLFKARMFFSMKKKINDHISSKEHVKSAYLCQISGFKCKHSCLCIHIHGENMLI